MTATPRQALDEHLEAAASGEAARIAAGFAPDAVLRAHDGVVTGASPNGKLVEIIELRDHPWFLAVQFHPEFKSKPTDAHPLFRGFIAACVHRREGKKSES